VLVGVVTVQADALGTPDALRRKHERLEASLVQLEAFCGKAGIGTSRVVGHSTDTVVELERLIKETMAGFPECVCFTNQLILPAGVSANGCTTRLHSAFSAACIWTEFRWSCCPSR
jgi:hypothetical protein